MRQSLRSGLLLLLVTFGQAHAEPPGGSKERDRASAGQHPDPVPVTLIVPMFMNWAIDGEPLPRDPNAPKISQQAIPGARHNGYRFPETKWVNDTLRRASIEVVYVSWAANGEPPEDRFQWKYDLKSRQVSPLTKEDRARIEQRISARIFNVVEEAHFKVRRIGKETVTVSFNYGWVGADAKLERQKQSFVIIEKPTIGVH